MGLLIATILLSAFALLAVIDGFYLHIFTYQLFNRQESKFEHFTHTLRAVLFPLIVYFLFIVQNNNISFYLGLFFVLTDIVILGIDAFVEKDSRAFMGGLPRWEYILHLFVNGFHFASIAVFLALKLTFEGGEIAIVHDLSGFKHFEIFYFLTVNLLPGAIILAIIHIMTNIQITTQYWNMLRKKVTCC
jgi:hypothetical protein